MKYLGLDPSTINDDTPLRLDVAGRKPLAPDPAEDTTEVAEVLQ